MDSTGKYSSVNPNQSQAVVTTATEVSPVGGVMWSAAQGFMASHCVPSTRQPAGNSELTEFSRPLSGRTVEPSRAVSPSFFLPLTSGYEEVGVDEADVTAALIEAAQRCDPLTTPAEFQSERRVAVSPQPTIIQRPVVSAGSIYRPPPSYQSPISHRQLPQAMAPQPGNSIPDQNAQLSQTRFQDIYQAISSGRMNAIQLSEYIVFLQSSLSRMQSLESQVQTQISTEQRLGNYIKMLKSEIQKLNSQVEAGVLQQTAAQSAIEEKNKELADLTQRLETTMADAQEQIKSQTEIHQASENSYSEKISCLTKETEALTTALAESRSMVSEKDEAIQQLEHKVNASALKDNEQQIAHQEQRKQLEERVCLLEQAMKERDLKVQQLTETLERKETQCAKLEEQLNSQTALCRVLEEKADFLSMPEVNVCRTPPAELIEETPPAHKVPENLKVLFERAKSMGIPQKYITLGYPVRTEEGTPVDIADKADLGDVANFPPEEEERVLIEIAERYCEGNIELLRKYWHQASFLEAFYQVPGQWGTLSHDEFCGKLKGLMDLNLRRKWAENCGYDQREFAALKEWRKEQSREENERAIFPKRWQPWLWLNRLAEAARTDQENQLIALCGFWADFSFLMCVEKGSQQDSFDWRALCDTVALEASHALETKTSLSDNRKRQRKKSTDSESSAKRRR